MATFYLLTNVKLQVLFVSWKIIYWSTIYQIYQICAGYWKNCQWLLFFLCKTANCNCCVSGLETRFGTFQQNFSRV